MRGSLAIAALVLLAACVSAQAPAPAERQGLIDFSQRPHDWPELEIDVRTVTPAVLAQMCEGGGHLPGYTLHACATPYFCQRRCAIWVSDAKLPEHQLNFWIGHERAHCRGYDHPGSSVMRDAWARAKANGCGR